MSGAGTISVSEEKKLKKQREMLTQKLVEITNKERQEGIDATDASITSVTEDAKQLKDDIETEQAVSRIIELIAAFINLMTNIINILPPIVPVAGPAAMIGGGALLGRATMGFLPADSISTGASVNIPQDEEEPINVTHKDHEFISLRAERNFLRCMVSYLLNNPIPPQEWLICAQYVANSTDDQSSTTE